jgi:hypothetical protein
LNRLRKLQASVLAKRAIPLSVAERFSPLLLLGRADQEVRVPEGKRVLRDAFKRLEQEVPERVAHIIRNLRHPDARWVRIPIGLLCIIAGFFSFLPVLGLWMLPLGLLLLAYDVPFLRKPVGYFTIWSAEKWVAFRQWLARKRGT